MMKLGNPDADEPLELGVSKPAIVLICCGILELVN